MTYDWSDKIDIQWAAFYSDCEHEVYEVTAGHRITLTYNLYAHEQLGGCFEGPSTIDTDSFTLYHCVKEALASPEFFPRGMSWAWYFDFVLTSSFQEVLWAFTACMPTPTPTTGP